jgi:hypothetical protein
LEVLIIPIPLVFYRYGHKIRMKSTLIREMREEEERQERKKRRALERLEREARRAEMREREQGRGDEGGEDGAEKMVAEGKNGDDEKRVVSPVETQVREKDMV